MSIDKDPVERKVQLTGGSTYTVSLPKDWASGQGIEPGCLVDLHVHDTQLVVTPHESEPDRETQTVTIQADNHEPASLALSVSASYIAGCEEIRVEGLRQRTQRRALLDAIRSLVGLEVMDESRDGLVARTMLDASNLSTEQTLAQIERTVLEMHEQALRAVRDGESQVGPQIERQDDDVDRLFALVSREFQQSLTDPSVTMGSGSLTAFEYYMAARQLERVGDHAEKIATTATRLDGDPPADVAEQLFTLGERSRTVVREALVELKGESGMPESVITKSETLLTDIESLDKSLYHSQLADEYLLGLVLDSIRRTTQYGVNIAESGLQATYRRK